MASEARNSAEPVAAQQRADERVFDEPQRFGDFALLGRIARGGMAEVFFAVPQPDSGELLALKTMRPHLLEESRFVDMFVREGRLATMLEHPCIVRSLEIGDVEGRYYILMEYVSGQDLTAILRRCQQTSRRVPVPHGIYIARAICSALDYAHDLTTSQGRALNIVNRDVSPSNVRITYDGGVKLLDFGIAQAVMQVTSEIGVLKGKFAYMSPEQIRGLPLDRRSDIFSLGVVLHEMLTCERLFREESEFALMEKVRQTEIKPPSAFNKRVPEQLDAVVMRALERDPKRRYPDAASMGAELEALLGRYAFREEELGELIRSLYPADFRRDQELLQRLEDHQTPMPPPRAKQRRPARQRRRRSNETKSTSTAAATSRTRLLSVAAALLVLGVVVLILALR